MLKIFHKNAGPTKRAASVKQVIARSRHVAKCTEVKWPKKKRHLRIGGLEGLTACVASQLLRDGESIAILIQEGNGVAPGDRGNRQRIPTVWAAALALGTREHQARQGPHEHAHGPVASRTAIFCRLAAKRRGRSHPRSCQPKATCRFAHSKRVLAFIFLSRRHAALRNFLQVLAINCSTLVFNQPLRRFLPRHRCQRCLGHAARSIPLAVRAVFSGSIYGNILPSDGNRCVSRPAARTI